jgi:hypothetical protein
MSSIESTSNADDMSQSAKEDHRTRFNTSFNRWLESKTKPTIRSDETYNQIVTAVEKWANGERFSDDMTSYNYGSR